MAVYYYKASTMDGKITKGQITTGSPEQLREALMQQKLFLISFDEKASDTFDQVSEDVKKSGIWQKIKGWFNF